MVPKCNPSVLTGKKQREIWEPRVEESCVDAMQPALWMEERAKEPKESISRSLGSQGSVLSSRVSGLGWDGVQLTPCEADERFLLSERLGEYTCVVFRKLFWFFYLQELSTPMKD